MTAAPAGPAPPPDAAPAQGSARRGGARGPAALAPTDLGFAASDFLVEHFPTVVDLPFTAGMEDALDEIAGGRLAWTAMLHDFYAPFAETLGRAQGAAARSPAAGPPAAPRASATRGAPRPATARPATARPATAAPAGTAPCPQCGKALVQRVSQFGPFLGCSGYPACPLRAPRSREPGPPRPVPGAAGDAAPGAAAPRERRAAGSGPRPARTRRPGRRRTR